MPEMAWFGSCMIFQTLKAYFNRQLVIWVCFYTNEISSPRHKPVTTACWTDWGLQTRDHRTHWEYRNYMDNMMG